MAVSCIPYPDWLPTHMERHSEATGTGWAPSSCAAFHTEPEPL
jgi:hypothetical protein